MRKFPTVPGAVLAVVLMTTAATAAGPAPREAEADNLGLSPGVASHTVTLITGDTVAATREAGGGLALTLVDPDPLSAPGHTEFTRSRGGLVDSYLVPHAATPLVQSGALDLELFNISGLIRQGYDDASMDTLPLIVEHEAGERLSTRNARTDRVLPSLGLTALSEVKGDAERFWQRLTGGADHPAARTLVGGPKKVWLNARMRQSLDASLPQIGVPVAWEAGHTGKDVTVAVLDSGIDAAHPDLAGTVTQTKDFTGTGSTDDRVGHGTHVAATIAGSGAASEGRYTGVAPDARLLVGKVLDDHGQGQMDDVIAGMEWAAGEAGAAIVNLSLGGEPTDGTDPVSQTLNKLSKQHDTLFVVAAGNAGEFGAETVGAPASADAALAVANVTKSDVPAERSSRGPRIRDGAVKPEIAAPGTGIVAARAGGTQPGETVAEHYTKLSGTSMAAPHVAGGAAILAQQHPDWGAERLKAALIGTAAPVGDAGVYTVGSGRLDLARATAEQVHPVTPTVQGFLPWRGEKRLRRTVTYANSGPEAVTLDLNLTTTDAAGDAAPARLAVPSASTVTVPADGTADVGITIDRGRAEPGQYSGVLLATTAAGTRLRTPVAVHVEQEMYDLTVAALDRTGSARSGHDGQVFLFDIDRGAVRFVGGGQRVRVPRGNYTVVALVLTPENGREDSLSVLAHPALALRRNTTVTLDARQAAKVRIEVDQPAARAGMWVTRTGTKATHPEGWAPSVVSIVDPRFGDLYAGSTPGVSSPEFYSGHSARLIEPALELFGESDPRHEVQAGWLSAPPEAGSRRHRLAHGGQGRPEDLDGIEVQDRMVVLDLPEDTDWPDLHQRVTAVRDRGGALVAVRHLPGPAALAGAGGGDREPLPLPTLSLGVGAEPFAELAESAGTAELTVRDSTEHFYELTFPETGQMTTSPVYSVRTAELAAVTVAYHGAAPQQYGTGMWSTLQAHGLSWGPSLSGIGTDVPANSERVEHYTPGDWRLQRLFNFPDGDGLRAAMRLEGGKSYRLELDAAVMGPGFEGHALDERGEPRPWARRVGDRMDITIPLFSDADGHWRTADPRAEVDTGSTTLFHEGAVLGESTVAGHGEFTLPRQHSGEYRLVAHVDREQPWWPLSTSVRSDWTFHSGPDQDQVLPLLAVRYAPEVDLTNGAQGGSEFSIPVTVTRQDGVPDGVGLEIEVSYDDGRTWSATRVDRDGDAWSATVRHPADGFASLRATATDSAGNRVEQTIIRAYRIGG
ncbi:Serine protease, subtilisin family [Amycolatopsis marina]|uniref:Serine protease, subtilisin family n=1 Tax=Amycolatopsis marina TaxID=490629 RepID=A0A1I0ZG46_9PSEU|nr:S8 family serine peptidase [Amycolatopsis marina]SFB23173.1 Serine protease, subtilisin family [Amycolatopsis marina]